ncbi:DUF3396 domain-containing protein [Sorangium sp. So ce145]|uniref:DUF3396 domain-containing protein n=1 Tax=Sorangium sp. So ce145 TaxID=3133285 RepID=UPI003F62A9A3
MAEHTQLPLEDGLSVVDDRGRTVLRIALLATVYFERGHSLEKRRAVAECFEEYRAMAGGHLRWAHPGSAGFDRLDGAVARDPAVWLVDPGLNENAGWEFIWHGGATDEEASHFMIGGLGAPKWECDRRGDLGFFSFALPITWFADRPGGFPSLLFRFCERIQPVHGYGGFGLVQSPNRFLNQLHEKTVYALAMRHPGLEIDYPITHSLWLRDGIKGVNWLTILGERWLAALGGASALGQALGGTAELRELQGGALVMAGPHPELGDTNRALYPVSYGPVSRALKPIRVKTHPRVHSMGPFGKEEFEAWLARLDGDRQDPGQRSGGHGTSLPPR